MGPESCPACARSSTEPLVLRTMPRREAAGMAASIQGRPTRPAMQTCWPWLQAYTNLVLASILCILMAGLACSLGTSTLPAVALRLTAPAESTESSLIGAERLLASCFVRASVWFLDCTQGPWYQMVSQEPCLSLLRSGAPRYSSSSTRATVGAKRQPRDAGQSLRREQPPGATGIARSWSQMRSMKTQRSVPATGTSTFTTSSSANHLEIRRAA
mmetsp:Transcript_33651/g.99896  ORF Transcript_33651/g.99896 Transcript_33651/m.99896 type:complete len:215 (-) Transcript_33651:1925-2569(-)